jgi:hypothetical protein
LKIKLALKEKEKAEE